jgi:pentose-5-phosphate-3-epimerase
MSLVVPAVLPISRRDLQQKIGLYISLPLVSRIQIDAVDGYFAAPPSWPYSAPKELSTMVLDGEMLPKLDKYEYEIDLMSRDPESEMQPWISIGATRFTLHAESTSDLPGLFAAVQLKYGSGSDFEGNIISFGLALNLASDLSIIEPVLQHLSYVQFMGIREIGKQGQPFDESVFEKVRLFHEQHPTIPVQIDGGVSLRSARKLVSLGVKNLVVGSALLKSSDPVSMVMAFEALENPYGV